MTTTTSISLEFGMPVSPVKFGVEPMKSLMTKLDVSDIHSRRNESEVNDFNLNNLYIYMYLNPYQAGFYTFLMICMSLCVCVCDLFPLYFLIYLFNHLFYILFYTYTYLH